MAVRPVALYPEQVDAGDPAGYPHGKAQNQTIEGDGTGTPLEATWLSDLWGFLQALLVEGEVTPSNVPDKVGASDYLDALKAVAAEAAVGPLSEALRAADNAWTGVNRFVSAFFTGHCRAAGDFLYCNAVTGAPEPRENEIALPLSSMVTPYATWGGDPSGNVRLPVWVHDPSNLKGFVRVASTGNAEGDSGVFEFTLPTGASLVSIRAGVSVDSNGLFDPSIYLVLREQRAGGANGFVTTTKYFAPSDTRGTSGIIEYTGPVAGHVVPAGRHYSLFVVPDGNEVAINWVRVKFRDPGPRNF